MIKILHVDDVKDDQEVTEFQLQMHTEDLQVDWVESGQLALEMLDANEYDCILCDYQMPVMDGLQLLKIVREGGNEIPFIFLTCQGSEELAAEALRAGADDYYTKEVGFAHYDRLINSIKRLVEAKEQREERKRAERALRESEEKYRKVYETAPLAFVVWDPDCLVTDWNKHAEELFGWSPEEVIGRNFFEFLIPEEARPKVKEVVGQLVSGDLPSRSINENLTKSGKAITCEWNNARVHDEAGNVTGVISLAFDVTERKKAEEVRESIYRISEAVGTTESLQELYSSIHSIVSELMPAGNFYIALLNPEADVVSFPYFVDQFDEPPPPIHRGKSITSYVLDTGMPLLATPEVFEELATKGEIEPVGAESIDWLGVPLRTRETTIGVLAVQSYVEGVRYSEQDKSILMFVSTQVAAAIERKRAEEALLESEHFLEGVFESIQDGISVLDTELTIRRVNRVIKQWYVENLPLEGKKCYECYHNSDKACDPCPTIRCIKSGHTEQEIVRGLPGSPVEWVELFSFPMKDQNSGEVTGVVEFVRDITERKRAEEAMRRSGEKYRQLFEDNITGVFRTTLDGRILDCNEALIKMLGYESFEEISSLNVADLYYRPQDRASVISQQKELGKVTNRELRLKRKDGEEVWALNNATLISGDVIQGTLIDITERKRAVGALQESEELLRATLESTADGILVVNEKGQVINSNARFAKMWRIPEELIETRDNDKLLAYVLDQLKDPQAFLLKVKKLYGSTEESFDTLHFNDGRVFERYSFPLIRDGKVAGRVWSFRDVTERKRVAEDLQASESKYRFLYEGSPSISLIIGVDGIIKDLNRTSVNLIGYLKDEIVGKQALEFVIPEHRARIAVKLERGFKGENTSETVVDVCAKDGSIHTILFSPGGVISFEEDQPAGILITGVDITQRERLDAVRESIYKLSEAVNTTEDMAELFGSIHSTIAELMPAGNFYIALYDPASRMLSFPYFVDQHEEAPAPYKLGKGFTEYVLRTGEPLLATPEVIKELKKKEEAEMLGPPAIDWLGVPLKTHDKTIGVLVVQTYTEGVRYKEEDKKILAFVSTQVALVIERKRAEEKLRDSHDQLAAANKELESFAYTVSHDLKAPLRNINGFSQILLEQHGDELDDEGAHYIQRISEASGRMGMLISDILKLSKITSVELKREELDLSEWARLAADNLASSETGRDVKFAIADGVTAEGDAGLVKVVLENLLGNAWKFTKKRKSPKIEFGVTEHDGINVFFVRDNGVGFDPTQAEKLFAPFTRLHTEKEFAGSGIGLATVQRIIHRHGGRIWAEGDVGKGATFYFTLG